MGADGLMRRADAAMYAARAGRRGVTVWSPRPARRVLDRLGVRAEIQRAVDEDALEFHHRPRVRIRDGTGSGWRRWCARGTPPAALDVSPLLVVKGHDPAATIRGVRERHGTGTPLRVEITESAAAADARRGGRVLRRIADPGVDVSIDDFGVGHSSLGVLRDLPLSEITLVPHPRARPRARRHRHRPVGGGTGDVGRGFPINRRRPAPASGGGWGPPPGSRLTPPTAPPGERGRLVGRQAVGYKTAVPDAFRSIADAFAEFAGRIAAVDLTALAAALAFVLANTLLRTYAWRNIVAAAYPRAHVRWRHAFGAYTAGVAVNAILPARLGDPVKLALLRRRVEGSAYPTLAATLVAETLVDMVVVAALMVGAWRAGLLPLLPELPQLPLFELSWIADNPWVLPAIAGTLMLSVFLVAGRVRAFWDKVRQGLAVLTHPWLFVRRVAVFQLAGWACRLASAAFFLEAFHLRSSLSSAVLVQVAGSASTAMPATPGGAGPKQALLVLLLGDTAPYPDVLAFSVGMDAVQSALSVVIGFTCMAWMLGGMRFRTALAEARAARHG